MAEVYLAHDKVLNRDVALKVLRDQYASNGEFVERFRREARNAAALSHPNIVPVYDAGKAEDGTPYIAMEYMAGGTLGELIAREGTLETTMATMIAIEVARALREAHRCGVVHRDVKSHNIFLAGSPASPNAEPEGFPLGAVKVGDFGIARAAEASTMTESNLVLGTPLYLSPEQADGKFVGPTSDLYSLGVILYEMLTGRLPFDGKDSITIVMKHVSELPPSPEEVNPEVPEDMNALVLRLLSKDPEDRHEDAAELIRDLRRVQAGLPPTLPPTTLAEVPTDPEVTKGEALTIPGDQGGKLRRLWKEKTDALSAAVVYGRDEKRRLTSLWLLVVASIVILTIPLGVVGWNLIQDYAGQASITSLQDAAQVPVGTPSEKSKETDPVADGAGNAFEKEAKVRSADSPSLVKASSYNASPDTTAEQGSGPVQAVAVPAALVTQGGTSAAIPEPKASPAAPTPETDLEMPTPEADFETPKPKADLRAPTSKTDLETPSSGVPSQDIAAPVRNQKITEPEEPTTKKADTKKAKSQKAKSQKAKSQKNKNKE